MASQDDDTDALLARVAQGHSSAANALLGRHRNRLAEMVRLRMDRRLLTRLDPSDVVQDALAEAYSKLPKFAATRPMPFYPWLRNIAWERLIQLYRQHVKAERRSVRREERSLPHPDESTVILAERFAASATGASGRVLRKELRDRVRAALHQLSPISREVVAMRHLEELPFRQIAAVLGLTEAAVYARYRRAVEQLAHILAEEE